MLGPGGGRVEAGSRRGIRNPYPVLGGRGDASKVKGSALHVGSACSWMNATSWAPERGLAMPPRHLLPDQTLSPGERDEQQGLGSVGGKETGREGAGTEQGGPRFRADVVTSWP